MICCVSRRAVARQAVFVRLGAVCTLLALAACSILPKPEAQQTYVLPASVTPTQAATPTGWLLRVHTPTTVAPLDSTQVIVQYPNTSLAAYRGIRWADHAPVLLRDRLAQYFSDSGLFTTVVSGNSRLPADVELAMTLRSFQLMDPQGKASVNLRLEVQAIASNGPRLLADQPFTQIRPVADPGNPDAVIAAFGEVVDAVAGAMATWLEQLAQNAASGGKP